jgi:hypothetical protein
MKKLEPLWFTSSGYLLVEDWCPMGHGMGLPLLSNDLLGCYGPVLVVLRVSVRPINPYTTTISLSIQCN